MFPMTKNDDWIPVGTVNRNAELVAVTRNDFEAFFEKVFGQLNPSTKYVTNWHVSVIAHALERCRRGELTRLVILLPPRQLKSTIVSVALPAYILGLNPSARIICASYGQQLAVDLSNNTRKILFAPWYQEAFPKTKMGPSDTQNYFATTEGGYRFATTLGGAMTGLGADFIILDDPQKASDMVYENSRNEAKILLDNTVYSRFNDPKTGVLIIVMQRLHEDDLIGHVMQADGWEVIKIPIRAEEDLHYQMSNNVHCRFNKGNFLQPKLFDQKEFDDLRNRMGTANFYAQYQQSPVPPAGNLFDWKWFRPAPDPPEFSEVVMSLDVAATKAAGNYSAVTVWGHRDRNWYLMAAHRYQYELPEVRKRLLRFDEHYRPDLIVIDGIGVGRGLVQELRSEGKKHIHDTKGDGKIGDAESVAPMIEGGRVFYLPDAPGLAAFRDEVIAFPKGKYNDQVDSMVQLLKRASRVVSTAQDTKRPERKDIRSENSRTTITAINVYADRRLVRY
jgi:predicted phage terminase large subunit-like protein